MSVRPDLFRRLREGTEVLRTGGGANLYAGECGAVLNLIEAAQKTVDDLAGDAYLYAIDELDAAAFMKALADTRDELEAAVTVFVSGQEEPK